MIKFYNKKHKNRFYKVDDEVILSSKNIDMRKASKKLINKFLDSFKIKVIINKSTY